MSILASRHRTVRIGAAAIALLAFPVLLSLSNTPQPQQPQAVANHYIGAAECKSCHENKATGDQHGAWQKEKHSQAYATLASDKAKALAKEKGIADAQKSEKCLKCHVTAADRPKDDLQKTFDITAGVGCESCHGPGEKHKKARSAAPADAKASTKPGYIAIPDDEIVKSPNPKVCASCHNQESPTFKPFCYHKAAAQIRHLNPLKPRTEAEKAALTTCTCDDKCVCRTGSPDGKCPAAKPTDAKGGKDK